MPTILHLISNVVFQELGYTGVFYPYHMAKRTIAGDSEKSQHASSVRFVFPFSNKLYIESLKCYYSTKNDKCSLYIQTEFKMYMYIFFPSPCELGPPHTGRKKMRITFDAHIL